MTDLSRCPHCGARGTYLDDDIRVDGITVSRPYCGKCGRNVPKREPPPEPIWKVKQSGADR